MISNCCWGFLALAAALIKYRHISEVPPLPYGRFENIPRDPRARSAAALVVTPPEDARHEKFGSPQSDCCINLLGKSDGSAEMVLDADSVSLSIDRERLLVGPNLRVRCRQSP